VKTILMLWRRFFSKDGLGWQLMVETLIVLAKVAGSTNGNLVKLMALNDQLKDWKTPKMKSSVESKDGTETRCTHKTF
jgi:hypothetical protein